VVMVVLIEQQAVWVDCLERVAILVAHHAAVPPRRPVGQLSLRQLTSGFFRRAGVQPALQ
jgi:hypothetical protein